MATGCVRSLLLKRGPAAWPRLRVAGRRRQCAVTIHSLNSQRFRARHTYAHGGVSVAAPSRGDSSHARPFQSVSARSRPRTCLSVRRTSSGRCAHRGTRQLIAARVVSPLRCRRAQKRGRPAAQDCMLRVLEIGSCMHTRLVHAHSLGWADESADSAARAAPISHAPLRGTGVARHVRQYGIYSVTHSSPRSPRHQWAWACALAQQQAPRPA